MSRRKPPQHPRKRAEAMLRDANRSLTERIVELERMNFMRKIKNDNLRKRAEKAESDLTAALANCEEQRRLADKWIAEWEKLSKERDKIEDERDEYSDRLDSRACEFGLRAAELQELRTEHYRILRDAASEAGLRLRMSMTPNHETETLEGQLASLRSLLNRPEINDFIEGVRIEAAHQLQRWGIEQDRNKNPEDWYWTVGYLAGKALHSQRAGDDGKFMHHLMTAAAVLANWHYFASNPDPQEWEAKLSQAATADQKGQHETDPD